MEWLKSNWLTIVPLFGATCGWLWAVGVQAWTLRQQQDQREWARFRPSLEQAAARVRKLRKN
jgi:hypothetical protein